MLAELETVGKASPRSPRRRLLAAAVVSAVLAAAGLIAWTLLPEGGNVGLVDVSFVTEPFEAKIYLDDELLRDSDGKPYITPCTVDELPGGHASR